jgi:hypothetical protein
MVTVTLESIDKILKEYDIDTSDKLQKPEDLFRLIDDAKENKLQKPDDISIEDLEDIDF